MTDLSDLLPAPAEREIPAASFARMKTAVVSEVETDLRHQRSRRRGLLGLRAWLTVVAIALVVAAATSSAVAHARPTGTRIAVAAAVAGSCPVAVSFAASLSRRPLTSVSRAAQTNDGRVGWVAIPVGAG